MGDGLPSMALKIVLQFVCWTLIFSIPSGEGRVFDIARSLVLENPVMSVVVDQATVVSNRLTEFLNTGE